MTQSKFKIVGLGNPAATATAATLLKDKEFRKDAGAAVTKTVKFLGITAGAVTAFIVGKKIVNNIRRKRAEKEQDKSIKKTDLSYDTAWYTQHAKALADAMPSKGFFNNYRETDIMSILSLLKTSSDFWQLSKVYPREDDSGRGLIEALYADDDINKYKEILKRIGVTL